MLFIGIDPGKEGAIAVIDKIQQIHFLIDWPGDEIEAANTIRTIKDVRKDCHFKAALEKVHSMPKQGVSSSFKFGTNFGIWKGILASFQISFIEPTPQIWQKGVVKKAQDETPKLAAARRIWPNAELMGPKGGIKDGRCDALLIADWCRRQYI
ncbi:MAG: hypothetical protein KKF27_20655 [Gammaproteobacteria bacterium]|nr:hypothetical protein [Gammaproteobacteria bacterium]